MSDDDFNPEAPFVPRNLPMVNRAMPPEFYECKRLARAGADTVHASAAAADGRKPKLTDAESAALARKRIDEGRAR